VTQFKYCVVCCSVLAHTVESHQSDSPLRDSIDAEPCRVDTVSLCCSVLQCVQCVAVCCSVLQLIQCPRPHNNITLQCPPPAAGGGGLKQGEKYHTTHYNPVQNTATQCKTLQPSAKLQPSATYTAGYKNNRHQKNQNASHCNNGETRCNRRAKSCSCVTQSIKTDKIHHKH